MSDTEYTILVMALIAGGISFVLYISGLHSRIKHIEEGVIPHLEKQMQSRDRYIEETLGKTKDELRALENYLGVEYVRQPSSGRFQKPKENSNG